MSGRSKECVDPVKAKMDFRSFGLIGGVAITISGRGRIPIRVRRPIRIRVTVGVGVTVVGSCGYRGPSRPSPTPRPTADPSPNYHHDGANHRANRHWQMMGGRGYE